MRDPYIVLGVSRQSTDAEIKTAFRALARALHPDVNPGDKASEERFKEATAAYDMLSDAGLKRRYDQGEINADGSERRHRPGNGRAGGYDSAGRAGRNYSPGAKPDPSQTKPDPDAAKSEFYGAKAGKRGWRFETPPDDDTSEVFRNAKGPGGRQHTAPQAGSDATYRLHISLSDAVLGTTKTVSVSGGRKVEIAVPPEVESGHVIRLKGYGRPGLHGGADGDAIIEINIKMHPVLRRDGRDIIAEIPVTLEEAVLGCRLTVPTIDGKVTVLIPEGTNTGTVLRLRGKGVPDAKGGRGDQLVHIRIELADPDNDHLKAFLRKWTPTGANPRSKLGIE